MRFLFALLLFMVCVPVHAATMCVPDLSTCESCTPISSGALWVADCCGTRVSGVQIKSDFQGSASAYSGEASREFVDPYFLVNSDRFETYCIMTAPVFATYINFVGCSNWVMSAAGDCATDFKPKCALTYCDEIVTCNNPGVW